MTKTTSRLGRGLGSLISGGTENPQEVQPKPVLPSSQKSEVGAPGRTITKAPEENIGSELQEISTEQIVPNPYQPRKTIDPASIKELAASIDSEGLLQPVVVRKIVDDFQLIAGERRWRAHQLLGRKKILARVMTTSELSSASLSLIENLQREGLNPLEESLGYHSLVTEFGLTQAKVAERVGKSRSYITNTMRFIHLDEELKNFLTNQKISAGHAKVLLGVEDESFRLSIGKDVVEYGWSVRRCEQEVQKLHIGDGNRVSKSQANNSEYAPLAQKATSLLNRKVKIQANPSGKGHVSFAFENGTDLQSILDKLGVQ
jgi:ParB family chromosome partitioning protein